MEAFCRHYAHSWNSTEAAPAVGLSPARGRALLLRRDIQRRIREINDAMLKASDITAQRVMLELARVAFSDIRGIVDDQGRLKPMRDLDDDTAAALAGIEIETRTERDGTEIDLATGEERPRYISVQTAKVKRYDKNPALSLLARHFKIVGDEGDGLSAIANVLADRLRDARRREALEQPEVSNDNESNSRRTRRLASGSDDS